MTNVNYTPEELQAWEDYTVRVQNRQGFSIGRTVPLINDAPKRRAFVEGYRAGKEQEKKDAKLSRKA